MEKRYHHLNLEERAMIQTQLSMGFKPAFIYASPVDNTSPGRTV
jgi:hypothetical protein